MGYQIYHKKKLKAAAVDVPISTTDTPDVSMANPDIESFIEITLIPASLFGRQGHDNL